MRILRIQIQFYVYRDVEYIIRAMSLWAADITAISALALGAPGESGLVRMRSLSTFSHPLIARCERRPLFEKSALVEIMGA
jgi:hypothetical protein